MTDSNPTNEPTPRWVKVTASIVLVVVLLIVVLAVTGIGDHGPGRHGGALANNERGR